MTQKRMGPGGGAADMSVVWKSILAGICCLAVAMGVGRFAYTALLPAMQTTFGFDHVVAGNLASVNYAGYLLGAFICRKTLDPQGLVWWFRCSLLCSVLTTGAMGLTENILLWYLFRFVSGLASAGVFILGTPLVMNALHAVDRTRHGLLIFSGVGVGIAMSGFIAPVLASRYGVQGGWVGMALLCLPLTCWCWYFLKIPRHTAQPATDTDTTTKQKQKTADATQPIAAKQKKSSLLPWLIAAYTCEGFGYIISGTFLVSFLSSTQTGSLSATAAWGFVGLAVACSIGLLHLFGGRFNPVKIVIVAHLVQAVGIILPVLFNTGWAAVTGGILYGATFMVIVALSMFIGRSLQPYRVQHIIAVLTVCYSIGQIIAPVLAGLLAEYTGGFASSLVLAAAVVILGALLLLTGLYRTGQMENTA